MTEQQVVEIMETSNTREEWDINCDKVKEACGGYPDFWFSAIILSGLAKRITARWGSDDRIHIAVIR